MSDDYDGIDIDEFIEDLQSSVRDLDDEIFAALWTKEDELIRNKFQRERIQSELEEALAHKAKVSA